ncbi:MAG: two-component system cell cycle sensor histidine kinase/response regulator CckA [Desulforhopalus sp.]
MVLGVVLVVFLGLTKPVYATSNKNVLILNSYHHGKKFQDAMVHEVGKYLAENSIKTEVYQEYMDAKRFPFGPEQEQLFVKQYQYKYSRFTPDVLVVVDNVALNFILSNRQQLFTGVPIVFLGINGFDDTILKGEKNITGIVEGIEYLKIIELFLRLHPKTQQIIGVVDASLTGQLMMGELRRALEDAAISQEFIALEGYNMVELRRELENYSPDSTILFPLSYFLMPGGEVLTNDESNRFFYYTGIPSYCGYSDYVGAGLLGGLVIDGREHGRLGAEIIVEILKGKSAKDIPIVRNSPVTYMFDYSQLERFHLKKEDLPAGVVFVNKPFRFYQEYQSIVFGVVVSFLMLGLIITFLVKSMIARRNAENNLRERETHLSTLLETIPDLVWLKDVEGKYLACNLKFERFYGAKQSDIIGKTDYDFVDRRLADFFRKHDSAAIVAGGPCLNEEEVVYVDDGHRELLETLKTPMFDGKGKVVGVLGVGRDITDRKKLEMKLQQSQKMEAIGTLAGGIAHDFNNILTAIIGFSELAYEEAGTEKTVKDCLREVLGASDRAKDLVEQILAFSRQGNSKVVSLDMKSIVVKAVSFLRPSLPTTISISTDIAPYVRPVLGDFTQLHQILINLCTNAFHAMEELGGTLQISLKERSLSQEELPHGWEVEAGDYVCLSVVDTGIGISKEVIERIFDPYFTTKEPGKGTGMGLSIVHGIVKNMAGFISVKSDFGKGTRVDVYLPIREPEDFVEQTLDVALPLGNERILFVDDEKMLADLVGKMLKRLGYQVTICMNSVEALKIFQENSDQFDLVITDQTMPVMDGARLSIEILQIRPDIPIILCTGYSSVISEKRAKELGIKELVLKPLRTTVVAQVIRKVLDRN